MRCSLADLCKRCLSAGLVVRVVESSDFLDLSNLGKTLSEARKAMRSKGVSRENVGKLLRILDGVVYGEDDFKVWGAGARMVHILLHTDHIQALGG